MASSVASLPHKSYAALTVAAIALFAVGALRVPKIGKHSSGITGAASRGSLAQATPQALSSYGNVPLSFEPNQGQTNNAVRFLSRGPGYTLFLTGSEAVFALRNQAQRPGQMKLTDELLMPTSQSNPKSDSVLRVQLVGSNRNPAVEGVDRLPGKTNYLRGRDRSQWSTNVPNYAKVRYADVFSGVDLVYYGSHRQLEYDFVVAAGADPKPISLQFRGARRLRVDSGSGDLVLAVGRQELRFHQPIAYQESTARAGGRDHRERVSARYVLGVRNQVSFALGP